MCEHKWNINGKLQWEYMQQIVDEYHRRLDQRIHAVSTLDEEVSMPRARIWSPQYDLSTFYVVFGPADERCEATFPHKTDKPSISTYADYFRIEKEREVSPESRLFNAYLLWQLPVRPERGGCSVVVDNVLRPKLPKEVCCEAPLADASLLLLATFLPHILYHVERTLMAKIFVEHCSSRLPHLHSILVRLPLSKVEEALTSSSCLVESSSERLEWLGDAVLKMVQTDCIVKSTTLQSWVNNMHEGHLNHVRSVLRSNERLKSVCKRLGIICFIFFEPLERGRWSPSPLEISAPLPSIPVADTRSKVCVEVIGALLGLAYRHDGYEFALSVADEMLVTIPWTETTTGIRATRIAHRVQWEGSQLIRVAESFTEHKFDNHGHLAAEALSHPTALDPAPPSYQRLEWIGEAVLCLTVRDWLFHCFPKKSLRELGLMESILVSNETLAYLCRTANLHKHISYGDPTMPSRFHSYQSAVQESGRGLWGTEPPKAMADVIESLVGAVHVHAGLEKSRRAALNALDPPMKLLTNRADSIIRHPRHTLLELGGKLTSVSAKEEATIAKTSPEMPVWQYIQWGKCQRGGHQLVATIECFALCWLLSTNLRRLPLTGPAPLCSLYSEDLRA